MKCVNKKYQAKAKGLDKDFRKGDEVTCLMRGEGIIKEVSDNPDETFPLIVVFGDPTVYYCYTKAGFSQNAEYPTLYHSHNITIKVFGEEIPKRMTIKYANLFFDQNNGEVFSSRFFDTKEEAINSHTESCVAKAVMVEIPRKIGE